MVRADEDVFQMAQGAYEASRVKLGVGAAVVVAVVPLISLWLGGRPPTAGILGTVLVIGIGTLVWRGGLAAFTGLSGLKAGLVPLCFAHAANLYGHVCVPGQGCTSLCVPACAAGGLLAGLLVELAARKSARPAVVRAGGATVALLTGALGCSCIGFGGLAGLALGMAMPLIASRFFRRPV